ncbi:MAG: CotH kinase family protein [Candidatus Hermodarchaeota archaeon]
MISRKNSQQALPFHHHKREMLIITLILSVIVSSITFYTYFNYNPITPSDFPKININCQEELNNNNYANCTFELNSENEDYNVPMINSRIKVRGVYNARQPKKGYRIELSKRISLLGMRKDDDWQLFAMFLDLSKIRIKLSFDLWRSLEVFNPTAILPDSEFVCLYLNGKFQGLYLLAEKNDRRLFELSGAQKNINSSLIFQSISHGTNFIDYSDNSWEQDWPNEDDDIYIVDNIMTNLIYFVRDSSNQEFFDPETGIYSKFDKLNLIDFFIYNFFILHKDFWSQNYYIIRDTYPSKFILIPWDFDSDFGQYMKRKFDADENPESEIVD